MSKILVVVDMQNDFIDGALGTKEAESIVKNVVTKIQQYISNNDSIYFTMDTHNEDYLKSQEGLKLPVEHCIKGSTGWELQKDIKILVESLGDKAGIIFEKNGFGSTELAEIIKHNYNDDENTEIELVGLCTDICVITNAILLKTYMPNSKISVIASCCAGVTEQSHSEAINTMKMCQIDINN